MKLVRPNPASEHARGEVLRPQDRAWLRQQGVGPAGYFGRRGTCGLPMRDVVVFRRGRRFDFARHCRGEEIERRKVLTFLAHDELGAPIDVVAWDTANDTVACWLGLVGLLGLDFPCPGIAGDPLVVFPDPLAWLKADRRGVVIVRPSLARQHLLEADAIRAADIAHAGAVESLLLRGLLPRITVPASSVRRAA